MDIIITVTTDIKTGLISLLYIENAAWHIIMLDRHSRVDFVFLSPPPEVRDSADIREDKLLSIDIRLVFSHHEVFTGLVLKSQNCD